METEGNVSRIKAALAPREAMLELSVGLGIGGGAVSVPEGQTIIARRFNAGFQVREGRLIHSISVVPAGLGAWSPLSRR